MQSHAGSICACDCMARFLNCLVPSLILLPKSGTMPPSSSSSPSSTYHRHPSSVAIFQPWRMIHPHVPIGLSHCCRLCWHEHSTSLASSAPLFVAASASAVASSATQFPSSTANNLNTTHLIEHTDYTNATIIIWGAGWGYIQLW